MFEYEFFSKLYMSISLLAGGKVYKSIAHVVTF